MTEKNPFKENKNEILYNLINAFIAGALVFVGACTTGKVGLESVFIAFMASLIVILTKFKEYWDGQKNEYLSKTFTFIGY